MYNLFWICQEKSEIFFLRVVIGSEAKQFSYQLFSCSVVLLSVVQLFSYQLSVVQLLWVMADGLWHTCAKRSVGGLLAFGLWLSLVEGLATR